MGKIYQANTNVESCNDYINIRQNTERGVLAGLKQDIYNAAFQVSSRVIQLYRHIYLHFFGFLSFVGYYNFFFLVVSFPFSRDAPVAYGGSQARGLIGAIAAGLRHSHSNSGSEPPLQPTPQLTAMPDR